MATFTQIAFCLVMAFVEVLCNTPADIGAQADLFSLPWEFILKEAENNPDVTLPAPQLIKKSGYPIEVHEVTTSDGYILTMHRIPQPGKPVVFLQHGILSSSADWIILGPEKSLGYMMYDAGYDVWMGNARGNTYSKKHIYLSVSDKKFWDFSWNEMGVYDLPAEIDYVLSNTTSKEIYYVGYSMGTTMFYILTSTLPQYNAHIRFMVSLAPIAFMSHVISPVARLLAANPLVQPLSSILGIQEFLPSGEFTDILSTKLCTTSSILQPACSNVLFMLCGYDEAQINETTLPMILGHSPAGTSAKAMLHYAQEMNSGYFRRWDHGLFGNFYYYGQASPPDYDLKQITTPIFLIHGENDWFGDQKDVHRLNMSLPNVVGMHLVPFHNFNHLDFIWANDIKPLLNDKVLALIKEH